MCRLFQDLIALETERIGEFSLAGGDDTFRDVTEAIQVSPEWLHCVTLSDKMYARRQEIILLTHSHATLHALGTFGGLPLPLFRTAATYARTAICTSFATPFLVT
jgi:hypothetical protein